MPSWCKGGCVGSTPASDRSISRRHGRSPLSAGSFTAKREVDGLVDFRLDVVMTGVTPASASGSSMTVFGN
jgi:hypothetical protein